MQPAKPIPIGVEFYKRIIDKGYYYLDKTLLIRDVQLPFLHVQDVLARPLHKVCYVHFLKRKYSLMEQ